MGELQILEMCYFDTFETLSVLEVDFIFSADLHIHPFY